MIQLDIEEKEIILNIVKSIRELDVAAKTILIMKEKDRNSVSNFAFITECLISSESKQHSPCEWVNGKIKTDTEEWTPTVNGSNFIVIQYFGYNIKAVVNMKVLPQQIFIAGICSWLEFISSKHSNIGECFGISVFNTVSLFSINCNSEINLK